MPSLWAHKRKSTQKTVLGFLSAKLLSFPELNGGAWGRAPYPWNLHPLLPQHIANFIFFENSFLRVPPFHPITLASPSEEQISSARWLRLWKME